MALGDGIRRNVARISQAERDLLIDAFFQLDTTEFFPDGVTYWDKQAKIHKEALWRAKMSMEARHSCLGIVSSATGWKPSCGKFHPEISLHYCDWTTDPAPATTVPAVGSTCSQLSSWVTTAGQESTAFPFYCYR